MDTLTLFYLYAGAFTALVLLVALIVLVKKISQRGIISRSLGMELLAVRFQPVHKEQEMNTQQIREKIALMDQFYTNLAGVRTGWWKTFLYGKPVFAFELTIPHEGEELLFFVSVSRRLVATVEKIIQGIFPEAHVEKVKDYNIFNPTGAAVGSSVRFKVNKYYPIRTYQKLETDPMKELTNVFTKLAKVGEGAALQIVVRTSTKKWHYKLRKRVRYIYEDRTWHDNFFIRVIDEIIGVISSSPGDAQRRIADSRRLTPIQEEISRSLDGKAGKALFDANIRLVTSAPDLSRAEGIMQGLEIAFSQYTDPALNTFIPQREKGRALKKLFFNFSFRTFDESKSIILGSEELTSIFHFPNVPTYTPKIKILKSRQAPPPAELPSDGLLLGYNEFRGEKRDVRIMEDDRRRHLYVIGQTGTGKSVFLENLIIQDVQEGKGVCVIDPHGDLVARVLEFVPRHRLQDVIYFDPGDTERPIGVNMLEFDPNFPEQKTIIVNELFSIFEKLFNMSIAGGPLFEQYFRNATMLVMDDPSSGNTILEIERVLADKSFRDLKLSRAKNIVVKNFWTQIAEKAGGEASLKDMVPYVASKIDNFIANEIMRPIVAQEKSSINFREIMDNGKIFLVNLSKGRLGDLNSSFIGLILVGKMLMAALSRVTMEQEKRRDFYLYIDEFQNVTTDSIATILSEARKYRLDLIITHQFIGQLKEEIKKAVFGNVGSMVSFRIGSDDGEFMSKQYKPVFNEQDLLNIDNYNSYVKLLIKGQTSIPFSMKTYPPSSGDKEIAALAKEISRTKYGRPREEVEQEILQKHQKPEF